MKASRVVLIVLTIWFLVVGTAAWAAWAVFVRPGMIKVAVTEHDWNRRESVRVYVPAGVANVAIRLGGLADDFWRIGAVLDDRSLPGEWHGDRDLAEAFAILAEELEAEGDLRILEVRDGADHVTIDLRDGMLHIRAESWQESVDITIPPSTLRAALDVAEDLSW